MRFSRVLVQSLATENLRLRAFKKIELNPGETNRVNLVLKGCDLAFVGADGKWILEKGDFRMQTGMQVMNITCDETYKWENANKYR